MDQIFLVLFLLAMLVSVYLFYRYLALKSTFEQRVHELFEQWKEDELQALRGQYETLSQKEAALHLSQWKQENETAIRKDAIERSRAVIVGKVSEHVVPFLPDFQHNPKDARFLGSPVDFVVFDGLDAGEVEKITFIEVKTGASSLTKRERQIREAINRGAVAWEEIRLSSLRSDSDGEVIVGLAIETVDNVCRHCQRENRAQAMFCGHCGSTL
jgi:predicted Holliday junction resolvase-like endonuclease